MENDEYGSIVGNPSAPFIDQLAATYSLATDYYATTHPSEPNYVAMVSGSTFGITDDGIHDLDGPSIFSQLATAGLGWRAYEQNVPGGCFTGASADAAGRLDGLGASGSYVRKHDPAIMFTSVSGDPGQCAQIQPLAAFDPGAAPFEFITPNLINDMHDGTVAQGNAFLAAFVPAITGSAAFAAGGTLVITFDEGTTNDGSLGDNGGQIATLIVQKSIAPGSRIADYADHFSLLRSAEDLLGLPCLAAACDRSPL